jgi:hypothetical protein
VVKMKETTPDQRTASRIDCWREQVAQQENKSRMESETIRKGLKRYSIGKKLRRLRLRKSMGLSELSKPRLIGRLEISSHSLLQFRTIGLDPTPHSRVVGFKQRSSSNSLISSNESEYRR